MNDHRLVDWKTLQSLEPICNLRPAEFRELAGCTYIETAPPDRRLFVRGQTDRWCYYLVKGRVRLVAPGGRWAEIRSGTPQALRAMADAQPRRVDAITLETTEYIRLDREMVRVLTGSPLPGGVAVQELSESEGKPADRLLARIAREYIANRLVIPRLPDVALRVRDAVCRPDADANLVARLVQTDPVLSARLIQVASSPLYGVRGPVRSVREAVMLIGLENTRNMVLAAATKALFKSDSPLLRRRMHEQWLHNTVVSATAYVLAGLTPGLNPDQAMLTGLLHDMGVLPILHYAGGQPDLREDPELLETVIAALRASVGAMVLRRWGFDQAMVGVVMDADNWRRDHGLTPDYTDVVVVAQLLCAPAAPVPDLPPIEQLPATRKLGEGRLDEEALGQVVMRARQDIASVLQMMG